ncbi:GPW/gp25 family protein [Cellulomonas sp. NPDC055163]
MSIDVVDQWTGVGLRLPQSADQLPAGPAWLDGMDLIQQSVTTILDTEPGERVMRPGLGCGLRRFLMAPNDESTRTSMVAKIRSALETWEPRIRLDSVTVTSDEDPTLLWVDIAYVRRADLRPDNLVYPFYLR